MIKCFNCNEPVPDLGGILISIDGDFVCGPECKESYERKRDHFLNVTIHSDALMEKWWEGDDG